MKLMNFLFYRNLLIKNCKVNVFKNNISENIRTGLGDYLDKGA